MGDACDDEVDAEGAMMRLDDHFGIHACVSRHELMAVLRMLTVNCRAFDHHAWSTWDAEVFEAVAAMIRRGYAEAGTPAAEVLGPEVELDLLRARLGLIESAVRDYHVALDLREHGAAAGLAALGAIQDAIGLPWRRGEELERRESDG